MKYQYHSAQHINNKNILFDIFTWWFTATLVVNNVVKDLLYSNVVLTPK
jgi:hypothetical protein